MVLSIIYHISYHIVDRKWQNRLRVGTDKPKLKVKMQSDDDVRKRLLEKQHFELAAIGVLIYAIHFFVLYVYSALQIVAINTVMQN